MPKAIRYKVDSVVFFSGDVSDRVFLLKSGNVALTYIDIETGTQITDYLKPGEFFGVKSAMGNYPREESAIVISDSIVYAFSTSEFDTFAQTNTRVTLQMIKVFSKQLRQIHSQLESLAADSENTHEVDSDEGLYSVANAFMKSQHFDVAKEIANRYVSLFPHGRYINQIKKLIDVANRGNGVMFGAATSSDSDVIQPPSTYAGSRHDGDNANVASILQEAKSLESKKDWTNAYNRYHRIIELQSPEFLDIAYIGASKCLYNATEYVRCIKLLTGFISNNPKAKTIAEGIFYLGCCYEKMEKVDKASAFFTKAASMASPELLEIINKRKLACEGRE